MKSDNNEGTEKRTAQTEETMKKNTGKDMKRRIRTKGWLRTPTMTATAEATMSRATVAGRARVKKTTRRIERSDR